jgi:Flp pilus assembly protein TadB
VTLWLSAVAAGLAAACLGRRRPRAPRIGVAASRPAPPAGGWLVRQRLLVSIFAGLGAQLFVGGPAGIVAALAAAAGAWVVVGRAEPPGVRREREAVRRQLPHVISLFGSALRGGAAPGPAVHLVCQALPGSAAERLRASAARLALGGDPLLVWAELARSDAELAVLGRAMSRAHESGTPVAAAVERLADGLAGAARADVEDRARAVGVKAALPLGLCLLPAFVLIGIVPLVAGLMSTLAW